MLTVEKLRNMQPWEIFAKGEWIDDWKTFNIRWKNRNIKRVAVRWQGYHDRAIYYHLFNIEEQAKADDIIMKIYLWERNYEKIARVWDKITSEKTIKEIVPCDEEAFNLYRY